MKKGFTLIELIFVIAVVGILAVTALPKLMATRSDARMSALAQNTMVAATEIASFAVARGYTESNLSLMSKAVTNMEDEGEATQVNSFPPTLTIHWGGIADCLTMKIENQGGNTEVLVVETNSTGSSAECDRLRSLIDTERFPIPLRGARISI